MKVFEHTRDLTEEEINDYISDYIINNIKENKSKTNDEYIVILNYKNLSKLLESPFRKPDSLKMKKDHLIMLFPYGVVNLFSSDISDNKIIIK